MSEIEKSVAICCTDLVKSYPLRKKIKLRDIFFKDITSTKAVEVLKGISLKVYEGEIIGVLGKNGAGKSTLLRILGGVYLPTSGVVTVRGDVGGLFELGGMGNLHLTGKQYAKRYLEFMLVRKEMIAFLLNEIQDFSELGDAFEHRVQTYSSGMRARLYFSVVTSFKSDVYLIDELLSVGDEHFQSKCWKRIRALLQQNSAGIIVTHDWSAVLKLCRVAHVIEKGEVSYSGPADKAVIKYLNAPVTIPKYAKFCDSNPDKYVLNLGDDCFLCFDINVFNSSPIYFSISIEKLDVGTDWEIIILNNGKFVTNKLGNYKVKVLLPHCPLVPGEYSLNVWLHTKNIVNEGVEESCDSRTWTAGNGFRLKVTGTPMNTAVKLPYLVRAKNL